MPAATRRARTTRPSAAATAATPRRCGSPTIRARSATARCCRSSSRWRTTRPSSIARGRTSGTQYRSTIFPADASRPRWRRPTSHQLNAARAFDAPIVTTIEPDRPFYPAEDYHQDYLTRHPDQPYIVDQRSAQDRRAEAPVPEPVSGRARAGPVRDGRCVTGPPASDWRSGAGARRCGTECRHEAVAVWPAGPGNGPPARCDTGGVRDLSGVVPDLAGDALLPASLDRLSGLDPASLPLVDGPAPRRTVRRPRRQVPLHRPELRRPRRGIRRRRAERADRVLEGDLRDHRARRRRRHPARLREDRLGSRARRGHRLADQVRVGGRRAVARRRLLRGQRSVRARLPARRHRPVGEGQERRHVRADRAVAGDGRRGPRSAGRSTCGSRSTGSGTRTARRRR